MCVSICMIYLYHDIICRCDICVDCHIIKRWFNGDDSIIIVSRNQVCAVIDMIKIVFTCFPLSHLSTISPKGSNGG